MCADRLKRFLLCLSVAVIACGIPVTGARGQAAGPVALGRAERWHSNLLGDDRMIWIYTPDTARGSQTRYPVIYVVDGQAYYITTVAVTQFLVSNDLMPAMMVVGIENTANRTRDLTPLPADSASPGSGGADAFLRAIREELIPSIERRYHTAPYRTLIGHSFGGIFAVNALLRQPSMFNSYVIASASLWWGRDTLVQQIRSFVHAPSTYRAAVYQTVGNEGSQMVTPTLDVMRDVEKNRVEGLDWKVRLLENDDHGTTPLKTSYDGLEYIFRGWHFHGDIAVAGLHGLQEHYDSAAARCNLPAQIPEAVVNLLGYRYMGMNRMPEAIAAFRWNVEHYPASWNVYDSLGEAYAKEGDTKLAIQSYEKSLMLYPGSPSGVQALKNLRGK